MNGREEEYDVKAFFTSVLFMVIIAAVFILLTYFIHRNNMIERMDQREIMYDADAGMVLMDSSSGLVGAYKACTPVTHIFSNNYGVLPGVYKLLYGDGCIIFQSSDYVETIAVGSKDLQKMQELIPVNSPALVY